MKKRLFPAILVLAMAVSLCCIWADAAEADTHGHWAEATIEAWRDRGLIDGYEDGSFRPDNNITRAEVCQLISTMKGLDGETGAFSDVSQDDWYFQAVANCAAEGYVTGYGGGAMRPNQPITRQEAFVIIGKVLGLDTTDGSAPGFADAGNIAPWAVGSVNALNKAGLLSGYGDNTVRPLRNTTRAEMVTMLNRAAGQPGELTNLLAEDSAHWMDEFTFDPNTKTYNLNVWLETYGVRFTPVIAGDAHASVQVTMSGSGIERQTMTVGKNQQFTLDLSQARQASNPEGTGARGIEDTCRYTVQIEAANGTYVINVTRPGLEQYVNRFERKTFDMSAVEGADAGKTMTYWEYVPDSYDGSEAYPVVLYLHGIGQRANEAADVLLRNAAATTFAYYGKEAIVIAPQCNYSDLSTTDMWTKDGFGLSIFGEGAYQILQNTKERYNTDSSRIYVVGLSMGGQGTCGMLATHPEEWAGAIVNAAPFDFGESNAALPTLVDAIKDHNIPVWFCYAEDDNSVDYAKSHDILIPALDAAGVNYMITIYTPTDYLAPMRHFCWAPMWADEDVIDWLLAQSK